VIKFTLITSRMFQPGLRKDRRTFDQEINQQSIKPELNLTAAYSTSHQRYKPQQSCAAEAYT